LAKFAELEMPRRHARPALGLEHFPILLNWKTSLGLCFIAFSSREPVSTSLENALDIESLKEGGCDWGCVSSNNDGLGWHPGEKAE
jgi:hypothetical protein